MSTYVRYPLPNGVPTYANATLFPTNLADGSLALALDTNTLYVWDQPTLSWLAIATPGAAIAIDGLNGDVSATGPGVVTATVNSVGGSSAANIHSAELLANAATSSATPNTIALRNASGQIPFPSLGSLPVNNVRYVDKNRVDTYTADGSFDRPYLTIQAAINAIIAAGLNSPTHLDAVSIIGPGDYLENVTLNSSALYNIAIYGQLGTSCISLSSTASNTQLSTIWVDSMFFTGDVTMTGDINNTNFLSRNLYMNDCEIEGNFSITNAIFAALLSSRVVGTLAIQNVINLGYYGGQGIGTGATITHDNAANKPNGLGSSGTLLGLDKAILAGTVTVSANASMIARIGSRIGTLNATTTINGTVTDAACVYRGNVTVGAGGVWDSTMSSYVGTLTNSGTITQRGQINANAFVGDSGAGGKRGLVPAPVAGDAATKFLSADGTWSQPTGGTALGTSLIGYGDGSDGALSITTTNLTSGPVSGGTLTRDAFFTSLTISGAGTLKLGGYRLFVNNTLDLTAAGAGAIQANGTAGVAASSATGAAAPSAPASNTVEGGTRGTAGGTGSTTTGAQATAPSNATPANGGASGTSGAGGLGSSGAGGATRAGATVALPLSVRRQTADLIRGVSLEQGGAGGPGGGGGGGDGTAGAGGGSGGNGGGVCYVAANIFNRGGSTTAGAVQAKGGVGGVGFTPAAGNRGGAGGGSAGGGGWIYFVYDTLQGSAATNVFDASGGTGGNGGDATGTGVGGDGGSGGSGGRITLYQTSTASGSESVGSAGSAGGAHSGVTHGTGGAGNTIQVTL